ncbi:Zinc finger MYM-type protein 1 [Eumeta japonica]|uniref:Zinc finger MYM-type protein 1 n=1 Tax=Eumeta variegata TaxID=151549 RepID=A0A4C2AH56_EUMVA|nr:Zinc finger MYM-type protein 1 [Eumeta japonica]
MSEIKARAVRVTFHTPRRAQLPCAPRLHRVAPRDRVPEGTVRIQKLESGKDNNVCQESQSLSSVRTQIDKNSTTGTSDDHFDDDEINSEIKKPVPVPDKSEPVIVAIPEVSKLNSSIPIKRHAGLWTEFSEEDICYWIDHGPENCQHHQAHFMNRAVHMLVIKCPFCTPRLFFGKKANVCDELIDLMSDKVHKVIVEEIQSAGYFSLSVDSTPDLSHTDQLSIILRYVSPSDGMPVERFLTFLNLKSHTGEEMANIVPSYLEGCKIDIAKCRGQSYDNAANMSGRYKGMQQKILEHNKYAVFIPCAAHTLNLIGRSAVDCCTIAVNFFSIVQLLYNFFSASTHRWAVLKELIGNDSVLKSLSNTRWEAHAVATSAILQSYPKILDALDEIAEDTNQKGETRLESQNISNKMQDFEFIFMLTLWNDILQVFHRTSKGLQEEGLDLKTCSNLYHSLSCHLVEMRNQFEKFEGEARKIFPNGEYKETRRRIRKKQVNDGNAEELDLNPRDKFRIETFNVIIDTLNAQMQRRESYPEDFNENVLGEFNHFHKYVRIKYEFSETKVTHSDLYEMIIKDKVNNRGPTEALCFGPLASDTLNPPLLTTSMICLFTPFRVDVEFWDFLYIVLACQTLISREIRRRLIQNGGVHKCGRIHKHQFCTYMIVLGRLNYGVDEEEDGDGYGDGRPGIEGFAGAEIAVLVRSVQRQVHSTSNAADA